MTTSGETSLLFGRPYRWYFLLMGFLLISMEDPVWASLWCRRSHSHSHYCWGRTMAVDHGQTSVVMPGKALLSGYYAWEERPSSQGIIPWQQCLPLYRSSYLWTIVVTAGQSREELKDRILLHRERTPMETIINLKCDLESRQLSIDRDLMSFILVTMQLLSESIVSWLPHT